MTISESFKCKQCNEEITYQFKDFEKMLTFIEDGKCPFPDKQFGYLCHGKMEVIV